MQQEHSTDVSPLVIGGVTYFSAAHIHRELGVARQTLWRWRKARKIPQGRRYRDLQVVFTRQEVEAIRKYANRLQPAEPGGKRQIKVSSSPKQTAR
jgi:hypothetical protein